MDFINSTQLMDLSALGNQPISPDNPAGADVRYDHAYDELQTEVDKLSSPAAAGSVDWEKVGRLAADILINKSKDLLAASCLAVALIHTRRNDGFSVGLTFYLELLEHFWEELYPQKVRMRARIGSLEWWLEKTETALKQVKDLSFPPDQVALIKENLNRLDGFLAEHLECSPSLAPIKEYFDRLWSGAAETGETGLPAPAPESIGEEPAVAAFEQQESQIPAALQEMTSQQQAGRVLSEGLMKISEASFCLWQHDLSNPQVYRLTRQAAWYAVDELPPADNGYTKIPPPSPQVTSLLFELRNNGDAEALLKAAESRQSQHIFWIDLSRLVAEALDRLGSGFQKAYAAVSQETAFLLYRLPGLDGLSFSDGTPFAAAETRQWLKGIALQRTPSAASLSSAMNWVAEAGTDAVLEKETGDLQQLVGKGKLIEAMEVFQLKLRTSSSRRESLLWRLSLSLMLADVGKARLALPQLEQVLKDIARHGLQEYDPNLAMRGLKLAWLALDSQPELRFKEQAQDVLHLIGRLDMPEMMRLTKV